MRSSGPASPGRPPAPRTPARTNPRPDEPPPGRTPARTNPRPTTPSRTAPRPDGPPPLDPADPFPGPPSPGTPRLPAPSLIDDSCGEVRNRPLDHLLAPLAVGPATLPCRIVSTSHQTTLVEDHLPTEDFVAYQEARARGGAGLIVMEAVAVAPSGCSPPTPSPGTSTRPSSGYRRIAAAVRATGPSSSSSSSTAGAR